jgi:microcystin-dependent protein
MGSLISYGNTSGNGATDFTNYGSTYNTAKQGFNFWNINSTQPLSNLAIIDNTQTYFKSQLVGCTAETPLNTTSVVNKTYADSNFMFKTGTVQESISGFKTFLNRVDFNGVVTFGSTLTTSNITADVITGTQNIYTTNTTGTVNIGTGMTTGTVNIGTGTSFTNVRGDLKVFKGLVLYDVSSPFSNFCQLYPTGSGMNYIMNAGATTASTHNFYAYNTTNNSRKTLEITYNNVNLLDATIFTARIIRTSNASLAHELFTGMTTGTLTMGSLTSNIINNSTTTNNSQHTFNNSTPICSVASPTLSTHLTRKDYIDNNFAGLTTTNSFSGVNTFTTNINCSSSITFTDIGNFSTIQQNSAVLNIENPCLSSTIRLKTRASTGAVQNSLTLNTTSCDILSPTLNLTGASPISILTPNNLNGTINLFNNLTTGGTLNIGSSAGVNVINGDTTINNDLICNTPATFLDYIITNTGLKWVDVTPSANYVESRVLGTALGFIPSFNLNSYEFYTNNSVGTPSIPVTITDASTTLNHQLICNNGAVFNTTLPTSTINASSSSEFTIRGFTDATYQTIAGMSSYLTSATASATYQTIAGMSSYLTSATASATYQPMIVGSIIQMAMGTVPTGYLACNGGSYSSSTYPALSAFLNFTYGGSSGSGMFQVPDYRGIFLRGAGTNGIDSTYVSSSYGSLQTDGIKSHTHDILFGFLPTASGGGSQNAYNSTSPNYNNPGTGSGRATGLTSSNANPYADTRPANFAVLFCIKY